MTGWDIFVAGVEWIKWGLAWTMLLATGVWLWAVVTTTKEHEYQSHINVIAGFLVLGLYLLALWYVVTS